MFFSNKIYPTLGVKAPLLPTTESVSIRKAVLYDVNKIMEMAIELHGLSSVNLSGVAKPKTLNAYKRAIVKAINGDGLVLVAENCNGLLAYIAGRYTPNIWSDDIVVLLEFGFFGKTKRASVLLLKEYISQCKILKASGVIQVYTMGELPGISPDYSKLGLKPAERTWVA